MNKQSIKELAQTLNAPELVSNKILLITTDEKQMDIDDDASLRCKSNGMVIVNSQFVDQHIASCKNELAVYNQIISSPKESVLISILRMGHIFM